MDKRASRAAVICFGIWQIVATAEDIQVNTYTTGPQNSPSVAADADGDFVVVWVSYGSSGTDSSNGSIQGQRYSAEGSPVGGELQINTYTTGQQLSPSVAVDADGGWVVVWSSYGSTGTDDLESSIQGQRYLADGSPMGGEFQINTYTTEEQTVPFVAAGADGDFVVVWRSDGSSGSDLSSYSVQGQLFMSDGSPIGGEFQVNTYTSGFQGHASVAADVDGNFVVVWTSAGSAGTDSSEASIQGQLFMPDGSPIGGEFQVNTYTTRDQLYPSVSMDADGDFVVVWTSEGSGGTDELGRSIQGQRFAAGGSPVGAQFQVNTSTVDNEISPTVAMNGDGDFLVTWYGFYSTGSDSSETSIQGQRYTAEGSRLGRGFQVNNHTPESQFSPLAAALPGGDFAVVWGSANSAGTDSSDSSIQWRSGVAASIFADGFESGDFSAWVFGEKP